MKLLQKEDVELQRELSDMLDKVSWHGDYYSCLCVFHDNRDTPAMMVYPDGFSCKSCGEFGSLNKLRAKLNGTVIRYREGLEQEEQEKPKWTEWQKKYNNWAHAAEKAYLTGQKYPVLMKYIKDRGFSDIIQEGRIGYIDGWISFPIFDRSGEMVDWVVRSTPTLETNIKYAVRPRFRGEKYGLYASDWDRIEDSDNIYIPFGILDMWALHMLGLPSATGIVGKSYILRWFDNIRKPIYLIPDLGEEDAAYKFKQQLGWRGNVLILNFPEGTKDCADILLKYGAERLKLEILGASNGR